MFAETQYSIGLGNSGMGSYNPYSLGHGSCCDSCAKGGPCSGTGLGCCGLMGSNPSGLGHGSCCNSCAKGGPCSGLGGLNGVGSAAKVGLAIGVLAAVFFGGRYLMLKVLEPENQRYTEAHGSAYSAV
jgi:hypothetical protein